MKTKRYKSCLLLLLAVLITTVITGCGEKKNTDVVAEQNTEKSIEQAETEAVSDTVVEEQKETVVEEKEPQESPEQIPTVEYEISREEAKNIAEKGFQSIRDLDAEAMIQYTNVDMFYYTARGEMPQRQELIAALNEIMSETDFEGGYNNMGVIGWFALLKNVEFYEIQPFAENKLEELNAYIARDEGMFWDADIDIDYVIEKAYQVKVSYDGIEEEDISNGNEPYVLVVCVNGEWKLDVSFSILQEFERSVEKLIEEMEQE